MISRRYFCSVALATALVLPFSATNGLAEPRAATAAAVASEPVNDLNLSYQIWLGGLHIFSFDTALERVGKNYQIDMTARTDGFVGKVYPYEMQVEARGKDLGDSLRPKQFRLAYQAPGKEKARAMVYREDGWQARKDAENKDFQVPKFTTEGTLDPASAALSIIEVLSRQGACEGTLPIFDGKRRYNLTLSHQGETELGKSKYGIYEGPATKCQINISRGDGFGEDGGSFKSRFPSEVTVWLAPVLEGGPNVPVRFQAKSAFGAAIIHLVKADSKATAVTQAG